MAKHDPLLHLPPDVRRAAEERAIRRLESDEEISLDELGRIADLLGDSREVYCQDLAHNLRWAIRVRTADDLATAARRARLIANIDRLSEWVGKGVVMMGATLLVIHLGQALWRLL